MTWPLGLSILALAISLSTLGITLVLLGTDRFQYATRKDRDELNERIDILGQGQSQLWRYAERIDDRTGGRGHQVLLQGMRRDDPKTRDR